MFFFSVRSSKVPRSSLNYRLLVHVSDVARGYNIHILCIACGYAVNVKFVGPFQYCG